MSNFLIIADSELRSFTIVNVMASYSSVQENFENKMKNSDDFEGKFSRNAFFIVANDEINASELETYMVDCSVPVVLPVTI